jgi:prepilin-type processing-associated H-X9-DG protein
LGLGGFIDTEFPDRWATNTTHEGQVIAPSDMIAAGDTVVGFYYLLPPWSVLKNHYEVSLSHKQGGNVTFCDGHVCFLNLSDFLGSTEEARRRWNNDNQPHPETWR